MRLYFLPFICLYLLSSSSLAQVPVLSAPNTIEVLGNGLRSAAFVVRLEGLSEEEEKDFSYALKGLPAEVPLLFDKESKIFFWRPEANRVGAYKFEFVAEDSTGKKISKEVLIKVLKAPSLEALPKGWEDMKKEDKYLVGRDYLPSTNFLEMDIAGLPEYELEIRVRDAMDQECLLKYIPGEGRAEVNRRHRIALIRLGGYYTSSKVRKVRRDLYEDLFNTLGLVFKRIESIELKGKYLLEGLATFDRSSLVSAVGADNIYLPVINLSFDDAFYQEAQYSKGSPMMIADAPEIKIDFNTDSGLIWRRARLLIDKNEYHAARKDFTLMVVKPYQDISSFDVDYAMYMQRIPSARKLPFGEHVFVFEAENAYGMLFTREAYARVVTLPARIVGKPMVFPSPFNPSRDQEIKIQYQLSMPANIEIIVFGVDGSVILKRKIFMGEEGGKKGYNTISWDGRTAAGGYIPNGIYSGVIIDRDQNRILEKFKISVYQ